MSFRNAEEELRQTAAELRVQLREREREYSEAYDHVRQLSDDYKLNKRTILPVRYRRLRRMIKRCTPEIVLAVVNQTSQSEQKHHGLKQLAHQFKEAARKLSEREEEVEREKKDLKQYGKDGLKKEIDKSETRIQEIKTQFGVLTKCVQDFQKQYQESKHFTLIQRYRKRKQIVKDLTRNQDLRPRNA